MPGATHATLAVTGAISIACCSILEGTVAYEVATQLDGGEQMGVHNVVIEHPSGEVPIILKAKKPAHGSMDVSSAGVIRTARLLFTGMVRVPGKLDLEEPDEYHEMHRRFCQLFRPRNAGDAAF